MNMFLSGKANINDVCRPTIFFSCIRGAKESSTPRNGNASPKVVTSCTILRNYIDILNPLPVNRGVYITRSANLAPLIVPQGPNDSGIARYAHTPSKIIISLPVCGGEFLYLLPCSTVPSEKNIYRLTVRDHVTITGGSDNGCISR